MYELLYKYLILNKKLGLPGVGNFYMESVPAKMDFVAGTLTAPKKIVNFDQDNTTAETGFYEYLIREMKLSELEVVHRLNRFGQLIRQAALKDGINLPGIGSLKTNSAGNITFYPETKPSFLLPEIDLDNSVASGSNLINVYDSGETKIILQEKPHPEEAKIEMKSEEDYWWVYAIILALCGLGALLYYYI